MSDSDDQDLARAIALSLNQSIQDSRPRKNTRITIDISMDEREGTRCPPPFQAPFVLQDNETRSMS